jgi:hypothetical protein
MSINISTTTDIITEETGIWYYASRSLLRRYFKTGYDSGCNEYALVQWLKRNNADKVNQNTEYFIIGSKITIPADECSVACIIGTELYGTAVTSGVIYTDVTAHSRRLLKPEEKKDFVDTLGNSYRGVPINLDIIKVVDRSPTVLDIRWAATIIGVDIPLSDDRIEDSLKDAGIIKRGMSLPNNTIYIPPTSRSTSNELRALMNHEIDHQYTYQIYDTKSVFQELLREQLWYEDFRNNLNPLSPYEYENYINSPFSNIRSFNDIIYQGKLIYEGQASYIEEYSNIVFDPNFEPPKTKYDFKIFHP